MFPTATPQGGNPFDLCMRDYRTVGVGWFKVKPLKPPQGVGAERPHHPERNRQTTIKVERLRLSFYLWQAETTPPPGYHFLIRVDINITPTSDCLVKASGRQGEWGQTLDCLNYPGLCCHYGKAQEPAILPAVRWKVRDHNFSQAQKGRYRRENAGSTRR